MKKTVIVIFSIPFIILLLIGGYFFWDINRSEQPPEETSIDVAHLPPPETVKNTPTKTLWDDPALKTPANTNSSPETDAQKKTTGVSVNNFYTNTATRLLNEKKDAVLKEDRNYYIDYVAAEQSFGISLTGTNLQTSRDAGEQDLLKILGITRDDACKLNVSVTVPGSVNEDAAGVDYHLSFCPDGISLP